MSKYMSVIEYNKRFKEADIKLKDYMKPFNPKSATFVKINGELIQITKVDEKYYDCIVDHLSLIPNGGVIYLRKEK